MSIITTILDVIFIVRGFIRINSILKKQGMKAIVDMMANQAKSSKIKKFNEKNIELYVSKIFRIVKVIQFLIPIRSDCLRSSIVIYILLKRKGISARLNMGVRIRPFYAHAWIYHSDSLQFGEPVSYYKKIYSF